jgi:hypothetical protein
VPAAQIGWNQAGGQVDDYGESVDDWVMIIGGG